MDGGESVCTMSSVRRFLPLLVAMLVLPVAAAAADNPIVSAVKRTASARSSSVSFEITTKAAGGTLGVVSGSGVMRGTDARLNMTSRAGGRTLLFDAILRTEGRGYVMYMRSRALEPRLPAGKSWLRIDLSRQAAGLGVDFDSLVRSSFGPLEAGLVSTKRLGGANVAGKPTTWYRATVDLQRAARAIPEYGKQLDSIEKATGVRLGRSTYDVWVASDGRIRRLRFRTPVRAGNVRGSSTQTITFHSFNRPVSITAPPRAQVFSP